MNDEQQALQFPSLIKKMNKVFTHTKEVIELGRDQALEMHVNSWNQRSFLHHFIFTHKLADLEWHLGLVWAKSQYII